MNKILLATVGGSPQPIITAIETIKPERVLFICSDRSKDQIIGQGKPCEIWQKGELVDKLPNIPEYTGLTNFDKERDLLIIDNVDDPSPIYRKISARIRQLLQAYSRNQILADFTGGTKSMSTALGMAATDYNIKLVVTTARRKNTTKVESGESTESINTSLINYDRIVNQNIPELIKNYNYSAAENIVSNILLSYTIPGKAKDKLREIKLFCQAFSLWDRFNHEKAAKLLQNLMRYPGIRKYKNIIDKIIASKNLLINKEQDIQNDNATGYEAVIDLLMNAERRAQQNRYDDAIGRYYRALELLAQTRLLKEHQINTSDVNLDKLEECKTEYYKQNKKNDGKIKLGLMDSYKLLSDLGNDPVGEIFTEYKSTIKNKLQIRNHSLFAHGFSAISHREYKEFVAEIKPFILTAIEKAIDKKPEILQLPNDIFDIIKED